MNDTTRVTVTIDFPSSIPPMDIPRWVDKVLTSEQVRQAIDQRAMFPHADGQEQWAAIGAPFVTVASSPHGMTADIDCTGPRCDCCERADLCSECSDYLNEASDDVDSGLCGHCWLSLASQSGDA